MAALFFNAFRTNFSSNSAAFRRGRLRDKKRVSLLRHPWYFILCTLVTSFVTAVLCKYHLLYVLSLVTVIFGKSSFVELSFVVPFLCTLRFYLLFLSRNAGSCILTPSEARWVTSNKLLPSTSAFGGMTST